MFGHRKNNVALDDELQIETSASMTGTVM